MQKVGDHISHQPSALKVANLAQQTVGSFAVRIAEQRERRGGDILGLPSTWGPATTAARLVCGCPCRLDARRMPVLSVLIRLVPDCAQVAPSYCLRSASSSALVGPTHTTRTPTCPELERRVLTDRAVYLIRVCRLLGQLHCQCCNAVMAAVSETPCACRRLQLRPASQHPPDLARLLPR